MDLLNGRIRPLYFKYLSAAFGSALISSIYGMVDMAMVGQYQGPDGKAALAVVAAPDAVAAAAAVPGAVDAAAAVPGASVAVGFVLLVGFFPMWCSFAVSGFPRAPVTHPQGTAV